MDVLRKHLRGLARIHAAAFLFLLVAGTVRAQWTSSDIGSVGASGSDSYNSSTGVYTLVGSGGGLTGTTDACHYVYQTLTGDGELQARVVSVTNTNSYARAGVMIRQSTAANDMELALSETPSSGINLTERTSVGGSTTSTQTGTSGVPYWVKVVKDGNFISYFQSADGVTWTFKGIISYAWSGSVDLGLAVSSHVSGTLCTATFDHISFISQSSFAPPSPWLHQDIGSPTNAGTVHLEQPLWSIFGGGAGITGTSDQFHFAYNSMTGDGVAIAHVSGFSLSSAVAGVIIRQDLTAGSAEAGVTLNATNYINFITRTTAGSSKSAVQGASSGYSWVKVARNGNTFYGYQSTDGVNWTMISSQTITMTGTVYIGVEGTSNSSGSMAQETLDHVQVWTSGDVGSVGVAGSDSYSGSPGTFTLNGSGTDINGSADGCHYVYQTLSGNCELQARVVSISNTSSSAKAGVMIRQSTTAGDVESSMVDTYSSGLELLQRLTSGGATTNTVTSTSTTRPYWVRMVRDGARIASFQSTDGTTWTFAGVASCSLNDPIELGLVVCSANNSSSCTATFDSVTLTQGLLDTDANGLPDYWEVEYFGNIGTVTGYTSGSPAPAGNGFTLGQDYSTGADPTNYYSQPNGSGGALTITPTLTIIGNGNNQISAPGGFAPQPLVVQVNNSNGGALLPNAPVNFNVSPGGGQLATANGGTVTNPLLVASGPSAGQSTGQAQAFYQQPSGNNVTSTITASSEGQSVTFTESNAESPPTTGLCLWFSADQGVSTDGNGNISWTDQSSNHFVATSPAGPAVSADPLIANKSAFQFSGSQEFIGTGSTGITASSGTTIIGVEMTTAPSDQRYFVTAGGTATNSETRSLGYFNTQQTFGATNTDTWVGSAPSSGTYVIDAATLGADGLSVQFYRNGQPTVSGTLNHSAASAVNSGFLIGSYVGNQFGWKGKIAEVLVYGRVLSSADLNQVNVYLADKYGLYYANATWSNAYSTEVQGEITRNHWNKSQADAYALMETNNPTMLTHGLVQWLKADDANAVATDNNHVNGSNVNSWADETGSFTVTQSGAARPTYVTSDINNKPAIHFSGGQSLYSPANIGQNADMTMIFVGNASSPSTNQAAITLGGNLAHNTYRGLGYNSSSQIFTAFSNDYLGGGTLNANVVSAQIATIDPTLTHLNFYLNGSRNNGANGTLSDGSIPMSGLQNIQAGICIGAVYQWGYYWTGDVAEVLVYDHQLTGTELQQVGVYLADKYGLYHPNATWPSYYSTEVQGEITRNHWNKSQADAYALMETNNPTMLTHGLVQWLKADDANAVLTDNNNVNGSNVNSWADETGTFTVSQTGAARPTYLTSDINGKPAIHFSGGQSLYNPANIGQNADMTMIFVGSSSSPSAGQAAINFGGNLTHNAYRGLGYGSSSQIFTAFSNDYLGGSIPNSNIFSTQMAILDPTLTHLNFYLNGSRNNGTNGTANDGSIPMSSLQNVQAGICIGAVYQWGYYWTGDIAEVLVYDHQLTGSELQQVGSYLADKYGLYNQNATWFNNAPYLAIKSEIVQHQWTEAQASQYLTLQNNTSGVVTNGLMLWVTADNSSTVNGTMTVADQAGIYPLSQSTQANQPSVISGEINGHAGLHFSGNQWLSNPSNSFGAGMGSDVSIVTVASNSSTGPTAAYSLYLGQNASAGQNRAVGCFNYDDYFDVNSQTCAGNGTPSAFVAEIATLDPLGNVTSYQNGAATGSGTLSSLQGISPGITLGAAGNDTSGWQGDISEVLVYDHILSTSEIQQLSIYLAAKYDLPYAGAAAPTISPNGGSSGSSISVSLAGAIGASVIKYSLDGTEPTVASPTYNGSITLTASALVQAAVFVNNELASPVASAQFYVNDSGHTGAPVTPTNIAVSSPSGTEDDVSWQLAGTVDYSEIEVFRRSSSDSGVTWSAWTLVTTLDPSSTSYDDTNVQGSTQYEYYVGTVNSITQSNSATSSAATPAGPTTVNIYVTTPSNALPQ